MFNEVVEEINWGGKTLTMKTGRVARQSDGAVMISLGDTVVLCTTVSAKEQKEGIGFFPLTVHYREMAFAAGKIPGGFFKREGKASEQEVLASRLIDRPIRPLFHPAFFNETQVICTVLSYDESAPADILSIIGASAALALSGVPYLDIIASARVGYIDGELVLNPANSALANSKLDLVVAGTYDSVMMVESEAKELSEEQMLAAVEFGQKSFQPVIDAIKRLVKVAGKPKWPMPEPIASNELISEVETRFGKDIAAAYEIAAKQERVRRLSEIHDMLISWLSDRPHISELQARTAVEAVQAKVLREEILDTGKRIDGRLVDEIRPIESMVSLLPKTHGSALFTRGETQGLVVATLGTTQDEQIIDSLGGEARERFMLHYIFPPYSVGEATPFRAPGRREVGHGKLAWRALKSVVPSKADFPYTIRVVAEITESNGSSSMATVCGGSLAMMDAGVPLKSPVSGIAMGLIKEGDRSAVLSDILGDEDYLGDMDFKVAGTNEGITALQMDIKITGITIALMKKALTQARAGRLHILEKMTSVLDTHRIEINQHAPTIQTFKIDKSKIREVIGPGGKVIKEICELTGAKIDISDDGTVQVSVLGADKLQDAINRIKLITTEPEVGQIFTGKVVKILESGAFISFMPGRDGFVHISEIADERIANINDHLAEGKEVTVKIIAVDPKGKVKLSMRLDADHSAMPPAARREREDRPMRSKENHPRDEPRGDRERPRERNFTKRSEDEVPSAPRRKVPRADYDDAAPTSEKKYFN